MAFSSSSWSFTSFFTILQLLLWSGSLNANGCYTSIISFGDSVGDTGNIKYLLSKSDKFYGFLHPPYGETFFHQPTGRCSNGRLIIDFLAEGLGLPLIPPFLHDKERDSVVALGQGVNYAVAGATALDSSFLEARGIANLLTNASLKAQLEWFKKSLPLFCSNASDCRNLFGHSLIFVGEFGGADYNYAVLQGKPSDEGKSYVPLIIDTMISTVNELIDIGAQTLVVQGAFPFGCTAAYLALRGSENEEYDNTTGCLIRFNKIAEYHNELLQMKLNHLRELHPNVVIIYADYYNAAMQIFRSPHKFGFTNEVHKSCCGGGGPFNFNPSVDCGSASAIVCDDPNVYALWDGVHLTEAAYRIVYESLFEGTYTTPQFNLVCPTSPSQVGVGLSNSM